MREEIERATGRRVVAARPVGGGCINEGWRAELDDGRTAFVKTRADVPPDEYENEAAALRWLAEPHTVKVPQVLGYSDRVLAIEWLDDGHLDGFGELPARQLHAGRGRGAARQHHVRRG